MEGEKPNISVVFPVLNEAGCLVQLYKEVVEVLESIGRSFELIFCDDGSTDETPEILSQLSERDNRVKVIIFSRNFGQTLALSACFMHARGDIIIPMDADMQNDPKDIIHLVNKLEEGYDVVSGWRKDRKDPFFSKTIPSRIANLLVSMVTGVKLHDYGCTLKAYRAAILKDIKLYGEMHRLIPAYIKWAGGKITEVVVNHRPRTIGKSKYNLSKTIRLILDLLTVRFLLGYTTKPLYYFGKYGLISLLFSLISFCWTVTKKIIWGKPLYTDPFFLASIFLFITGFQFLFFGLLAELNMRIYYESQCKPPFLIKKYINLKED